MKRYIFVVAVVTLSLACATQADVIYVASGGGNTMQYKDIKISRVDAGKIWFRTATGGEASREVDKIVKISVDDEPGFNLAEEAFASKNWTEAADGYSKALRASDKQWLKDRSAVRLLESASKANRLDATVTAFIYLVEHDPKLAAESKPKLVEGAPGLDAAAVELRKAANEPKLADDKKNILLNFLLEIHRARKDTAAQAAVVEELVKRTGDNVKNDPTALAALAGIKLNVAKLALDEKKFAQAISEIDTNKRLFVEPALQLEALFILAEAGYGIDGDSKDPKKLKDLSLGYMRVVTIGKDISGNPHKAESLIRTAELLEKLNEPKEALNVYQEVASLPDSPLAAKAKEAVDRLGKPN